MTTEDAPQVPPSPVEIKVPPGKWIVTIWDGEPIPGAVQVEGPVVLKVTIEAAT